MDGVEALRAEGAVQALTALERGPGFGGLRIDDDGTVEVSFTTDLPASARALVEACPAPVRLRRVEHTWAGLAVTGGVRTGRGPWRPTAPGDRPA